MAPKLPLHEMTVAEKLQVMEELWEDLSRNPDALEPPAWHEAELRAREEEIASGEVTFKDWEQAKAELRERLK